MSRLSKTKRYMRSERQDLSKQFTEVPRSQWPGAISELRPIRVWENCDFIAQVFETGDTIRISVTKRKIKGFGSHGDPIFGDRVTWDELQFLKNSIGYKDQTAVELYPPKADEVTDCNMRHLWILPEAPDFMWRSQ